VSIVVLITCAQKSARYQLIWSIQTINEAVIITKPSPLDKLEAKTFIEAVGAGITSKWID
jgi:hypothetical protein